MKRGKPLARRTPLKSTGRLRRSRLRSTRDRTDDEWAAYNLAKAAVRARSGGSCEVRLAANCERRASDLYGPHHRLPQGKGGPDTLANLLDVCGPCSVDVDHGHVAEARRRGLLLRRGEDPEAIPVR